jgi:hypothetical protein
MKAYGGVSNISTNPQLHLHAPAALIPIPIEQKAEWSPQQIWTLWNKNPLTLPGTELQSPASILSLCLLSHRVSHNQPPSLTNCLEGNSHSDDYNLSSSEGTPHFLWNQNVHCHIHHQSPFWPRWIQSTSTHLTSLCSAWVLRSNHVRLGPPSVTLSALTSRALVLHDALISASVMTSPSKYLLLIT